jgi:hypothetical protein
MLLEYLCIESSRFDLGASLFIYDPKAIGSVPDQTAAGYLNGFIQPSGPGGSGDPDGVPKIFDNVHRPL